MAARDSTASVIWFVISFFTMEALLCVQYFCRDVSGIQAEMFLLRHIQEFCRIQCKNKYLRGIFLKSYIEERAMEIAKYIIENNATVRQTANQFGISKSKVHKDVTERLPQINPALAQNARKVLDVNKSERHIRGGLATREKYLHQHI